MLNFAGRPRTEGRNQLVLNLARPDVRAYVFGFLDKLVTENQIAFLKWDYNRNWSEPGWPAVAPDEQKQVYVKYIDNLYSILRELREKHPGLKLSPAPAVGGRVDLGIMGLTDEVWPSDNTDPFDRLTIQDGFTYALYAGSDDGVGDGLAELRQPPDALRSNTASFPPCRDRSGVGANLKNWQDADFATAKHLIAEYKQIRETVQHGSLYRLISPRNGSEYSVTESVALDRSQAAVFALLHSSQFGYSYPAHLSARPRSEGAVPTALDHREAWRARCPRPRAASTG